MRHSRMLRFAICSGALFLLFAVTLQAQSDTSQISGFIKDQTDSVIPGASVSVLNEATGAERRTMSGGSGYFIFTNLPSGFYTVTVEAAGFKRYLKSGNKLDANIPLSINAVLAVGTVSETIEVVASTANVQSDSATVGKLVESRQIENMMVNGRNPLFLALLKPGVRGGSLAGFNFGMSSGGFSINGSRTQDLLITFDGAVGIRTRANGTGIGASDMDTVQEIQILTANYNAEYGRSSGGQIRMVSKSGGRDFHGSLYEYLRNDVLDANSWSRNRAGQSREKQRYNQFGYSLSGPVYIPGRWNTDKNKLFFLWSQEWVKLRREVTSIQTVPSLAMRNGDFSELLDPANPFFKAVRTVKDPTTGVAFPNNVIPQNLVSANGLGFLRAYPAPTPGFLQGTANFIQTRPQPTNQRKDTISIDFTPSERHTIRLRHQNYNWTQIDAFRSGFDRAVTDWNRPNKTISLNHIWAMSPRMTNEFVAAASVDRVYIEIDRAGGRFQRSKYGINYPYLYPERKEIPDKIPTLAISNFATLDGGPYPAYSAGPIYTFSNNTTLIRGAHTLKFGVAFERSGQNDFDQINVTGVPGGTNNQNGRFVFDDSRAGAATTGLAIANAAMGLFSTYAEIGQRAYTPYRGQQFEWFVQDSWKATPKLRVELGVRHTMMTPYYYSLWGNMAVFDPSRYNPAKAVVQDPKSGYILSGDRYNGVIIPGKSFPEAAKGRIAIADSGQFNNLLSGGDRAYPKFHGLNLQPRIGMAYAFNTKNVLRAGLGRFMSRPGVSDSVFLGGNPPFQPMASIANGQADNPGGGQPSNFPFFFMTMDPVFKIPSAWNWNITFEREIWLETTVSVSYVGRTGLHLERERNINALEVGTVQKPENKGINTNVLRPYKGYAVIALAENAGRSEYSGLQLDITRRFSRGFSYGIAYTYAKSEDNASTRRDRVWNPWNDSIYWGPSSFDTRHVAVINFIYQLPFLNNQRTALGQVLGGWSITGVTQFQTGTPFSVGTNEDFAGIGASGEFQPWEMGGSTFLARSQRQFSQGSADKNFYFQTTKPDGSAIFTRPAAGTFASSQGRNIAGNNPGFQNWNIALFKDFPVAESKKFQFRAEFFNWLNHPNWDSVNTTPTSGTFGKVTSKSSERNVQVSLRFSF